MTYETLLGGVMLLGLTVYVLTGGADFGGGVWDLFATGSRARAQRSLIAQAIGPIWEANHVWVILVVVLLFVAFPVAFACISTALNIPLTLLLFGIVLRGSAFAFRAHAPEGVEHGPYSRLFAISSVLTPFMLGVSVGAGVSGSLRANAVTATVETDYVSSWLAPFPLMLGLFTLALCAFLAAVYLILETSDEALREDFRARALVASGVTGVLAWACFLLAGEGAPLLREGLSSRAWSLPFQAVTGMVAVTAIVALLKRRYRLARAAAMGQVVLVLWGWGFSQYPYLLVPDLTLSNAAAPDSVLRATLLALAAGSVVLVPSFVILFWLFKQRGASRIQS